MGELVSCLLETSDYSRNQLIDGFINILMRRTGDIVPGLGVTLLRHKEIRKSVGRAANSFLLPCIREIVHRGRHVRTAADCSGAVLAVTTVVLSHNAVHCVATIRLVFHLHSIHFLLHVTGPNIEPHDRGCFLDELYRFIILGIEYLSRVHFGDVRRRRQGFRQYRR